MRKMTRSLRASFELKLSEQMKNNSKAFWRYANTRLKTKESIDSLVDSAGSIQTNPVDKAELLSNFFGNVFVDEDVSALSVLTPRLVTEELRSFKITAEEPEVGNKLS